MKRCYNCGYINNDSDTNCGKCGNTLIAPGDINQENSGGNYNRNRVSSNSFFKIIAIVFTIVSSFFMIVYANEMGAKVIIFPAVLGTLLVLIYLRIRLSNNIVNGFINNATSSRKDNSDSKIDSISRKSANASYILLILSGALFSFIKVSDSLYPIYASIVCYVIGFILMIVAMVSNPKNKMNISLMIVYIVLTILIIVFLGFIIACIETCTGVTVAG